MTKRQIRWLVVLFATLGLVYQLPNLALLAHRGGFVLVETKKTIGVDITTRGGWYPVASTDSSLGRLLLPEKAPAMVAYHNPSLLLPWRRKVFAVMSLSIPPEAATIESNRTMPWGEVALVKPRGQTAERLYVIPALGIGILTASPEVLDDIVGVSARGS